MNSNEIKIDAEEGNNINFDPEIKFSFSKISIKGTGNYVKIHKALSYNKLDIQIKGNNKFIEIRESNFNINNLKIVSIRGNNQKIRIGKNFSLGGMEIQMNDGDESIIIGDDCLFSWGIKARTSDGHSVIDIETNKAINLPKDIIILDRVWIGEDVKILKGVTIPNDVIIASFAVITKPFSFENAFSIIGGFPAKVIKRNVKWDKKPPHHYNSTKFIKD